MCRNTTKTNKNFGIMSSFSPNVFLLEDIDAIRSVALKEQNSSQTLTEILAKYDRVTLLQLFAAFNYPF